MKNRSVIISVLNGFAYLLTPFFSHHTDFLRLFFKREGKELLGKKHRSLWILLSIMAVTFIAIGFSNGSLIYLRDKMSDPFINWVNIDIPYGNAGLANELIESLNIEEIKKKFGFASLNGYYRYDLNFRNKTKNGTYRYTGRTIEYDSPLLEVIFDKDNLVSGQAFKDEFDIGFIVTEKFLKELDMKPGAGFLYLYYGSDISELVTDIPLPIIAIVKELPDMAYYATTPYFYNQRNSDNSGAYPFSPAHTKDLVMYIPGDTEKFEKIYNIVQHFISSSDKYNVRSPSISHQPLSYIYTSGFELRVSFIPALDGISELKALYHKVDSLTNASSNQIIQLFDYNTVKEFPYRTYDHIAVNFNSLDKIRSFKDFLFTEHKVDLEMAQIESKENFNLVSKLTRFISLILLIFCILSISMFLSNLLKNHLLKIRMNIGTFKAFGLGNVALKRIYFSIVGIIISISIIFSISIASLFGYSGGIRLILYMLKIELEERQSYFELIDWWTLIAILAILIVSMYAIYVNNNKMFKDTPGNLINARE